MIDRQHALILIPTGVGLVDGRRNCLLIYVTYVERATPTSVVYCCVMIQQNATFGAWGPGSGVYSLQIRTLVKFLYNAPSLQVSSSYV